MIRGINVSGKNVITMEALRSLVAACGCRDLRTYIQSGNVVLSSPSTAAACAAAVEQALAKRLGSFLKVKPKAERLASLAEACSGGDRFAAHGKEIYLYCPHGFGTSTLAATHERVLQVPATVRNWRTVVRLEEMTRSNDGK